MKYRYLGRNVGHCWSKIIGFKTPRHILILSRTIHTSFHSGVLKMSSELSANARKDLNEKTDKDQNAEINVETQHMQELEVDVGKILNDEGLEDIEGDTSPYPEG